MINKIALIIEYNVHNSKLCLLNIASLVFLDHSVQYTFF